MGQRRFILVAAVLVLSAVVLVAGRYVGRPFDAPKSAASGSAGIGLAEIRPEPTELLAVPAASPAADLDAPKHMGRQQRREQMLAGKKQSGLVQPPPAPRGVTLDDLLGSDTQADRVAAFEKIDALANEQPKALALGLIRWLPTMLQEANADPKRYDDVEKVCLVAILLRPQDSPNVAAEQRARVVAALNQRKFDKALALGRGYFGVAPLNQTSDAQKLIAAALKQTVRIDGIDLSDSSTRTAVHHAIQTTPVDSGMYAASIERYAKSKQYNDCIACGNVLLLAGRPADARTSFEAALASLDLSQKSEQKKIQGAADGIARAICALDASPARADALINAMRNSDVSAIKSISAQLAETLGLYEYRSQVGRKLALSTEPPPTVAPSLAISKLPPSETVPVAGVPINQALTIPPLELQRQKDEAAGVLSADAVTIDTGFDCSPTMPVHRISPTHFAMQPPTQNWFMFRVHGVAGRTIRFDMVRPAEGLPHWSTLNPVYCYATDSDDPKLYAADVPGQETSADAAGQKSERAWNGPLLPSTQRQQWHFIANGWEENVQRYSFVQRFEKDTAIVAMRVPCPPAVCEQELRHLASNAGTELVEVGRSTENRPLLMLIFSGGEEARRTRPCILVYAGEHADEHDAMWAAIDMARFCASDTLQAQDLRSHFTILILPVLDPDAAALGRHSGAVLSFQMGARTGESIQYSNWLAQWIAKQNRLDVVLDLHNIQSSEGPEIAPALLESTGERGVLSTSLNASILQAAQAVGFTANNGRDRRGWSPARLGGWLAQQYGPLTLAYELNSQSASEHLNLIKMNQLGSGMLLATAQFLETHDGQALSREVDARRAKRLQRLASSSIVLNEIAASDAIEQESASWKYATADELKQIRLEKWVP